MAAQGDEQVEAARGSGEDGQQRNVVMVNIGIILCVLGGLCLVIAVVWGAVA